MNLTVCFFILQFDMTGTLSLLYGKKPKICLYFTLLYFSYLVYASYRIKMLSTGVLCSSLTSNVITSSVGDNENQLFQ